MATTTFGAKILKDDQLWYLQHVDAELRRLEEASRQGDWNQLADQLPHLARGGRCYGFEELSLAGERAVEACARQDSAALKAALSDLRSGLEEST